MKVTVKNKQSCSIKKVWLSEECSTKLQAAKILMLFFNEINRANSDGYYIDAKEMILEMLADEENGEILEETVKKSLKEFSIKTDIDCSFYYVIIKHGIRYFVPDNLTPDQEFWVAYDLVNSGDQIVGID